jgi:kynureninase
VRPGWTRDACLALDRQDPLSSFRDEFVLDADDLVYFDGNSLGRLPRVTEAVLADVVSHQWGGRLIRSWQEQWMAMPLRVGDLIGTSLLGAENGEVVLGDNTTVSLYKAMSAVLDATPERRAVVIERDNFPTDRYLVESLAAQRGLQVRWLESGGADGVQVDMLARALDTSVALVVLSHVDYRSAALLDMAALTAAASAVGAVTLWDLCHSVGAVPLDLPSAGVDLAVGCTYKYLNGGPGAPAFTYVSAALQRRLRQPIWGWWSRADMFDMAQGYQPAAGISAWLTGTPGVLSLAGVEPGVAMVARAGVRRIREKSTALTELARELATDWLEPAMGFASPREASRRGSHVTLTHPDALDLCRRLTDRGVIPDFRRPDGIRIGLAPLTTRFVDVFDGLAVLRDLLGG